MCKAEPRGIIIMGSSRNDGDSARVAQELSATTGFTVLDLTSLDFSDFDYQARNSNDDFLPTIMHTVENFDHIIWLTPVYWYAMSALLKRFIDRISDCLKHEIETGRKFRGMSMSLVSVSNDVLNDGFNIPFKLTADYLGMNYCADAHVVVSDAINETIAQQLTPFIGSIKNEPINREH